MESSPSVIGEIFSELFKIWGAMVGHLVDIAPKVFSFSLWALSALIILPAVFIAGNLYPLWEEWGEDF